MERQATNMEQESAYIEKATDFVNGNIIQASEGRECVDGRYDQHGVEGGLIARPGADFGYVMGLLALSKDGVISVTPQQAVDSVYKAVTENGGRFYAHSDHHAIENGSLTGCGHIIKSTLPEH